MEEQHYAWKNGGLDDPAQKTHTFWEDWKGYIFLASLLGIRALISLGRGDTVVALVCITLAIGDLIFAVAATRERKV